MISTFFSSYSALSMRLVEDVQGALPRSLEKLRAFNSIIRDSTNPLRTLYPIPKRVWKDMRPILFGAQEARAGRRRMLRG